MPLFFNLFMASLFFFGSGSLYLHFSGDHSITSLYSWISAQPILGTFLFLVGVGLYYRVAIARTAGIAIALGSLVMWALMPILVLFLFFANSFLGVLFFGKAPNLTGLPGLLGGAFVLSLLMVYFFYKSLQALRSPEVNIAFPEDLWFGQDLIFGKLNGRVAIFLVAMLAIIFVDRWSVYLMSKKMYQAKGEQEAKEVLKALSEDPQLKILKENAERERKEKAEAARAVKRCQFSFDEKKLLLLGSDGSVHYVDLKTGQVQKKMLGESRPHRSDILTYYSQDQRIAPDLEHYFDGHYTIRSFVDPNSTCSISISDYLFIAFTTAPNQFIALNKKENNFQLLEIPTKKVIWSSVALDPKIAKTTGASTYVNYEKGWLLLRTDGDVHHLLNMRDGKYATIEIPFRYLSKAWGEPSGVLWSFTGPAKTTPETIKTYSLELPQGTWTEQSVIGEMQLFDPASGIGLTAGRLSSDLLRKDQAPVKVFKSQVLGASLMNPGQWILAAETEQSQAALLDTVSGQVRAVGDIFNGKMDRDRTCIASSRRHYLWALAFGPRVEVFWSSQLAQPNVQPMIRNLEIEAVQ